jgi:hypothetical protein
LVLHNNNFFYNSLSIYNTSLLGEFVDFEQGPFLPIENHPSKSTARNKMLFTGKKLDISSIKVLLPISCI